MYLTDKRGKILIVPSRIWTGDLFIHSHSPYPTELQRTAILEKVQVCLFLSGNQLHKGLADEQGLSTISCYLVNKWRSIDQANTTYFWNQLTIGKCSMQKSSSLPTKIEVSRKKNSKFWFFKNFIITKISGDNSYVQEMPIWLKSHKKWGSYSQKTVKIACKIHGGFPVTFELFFAIIPSIMAQFRQNWHFFNITFVARDFNFFWKFLKKRNFKDFFQKLPIFCPYWKLYLSLCLSLSGC